MIVKLYKFCQLEFPRYPITSFTSRVSPVNKQMNYFHITLNINILFFQSKSHSKYLQLTK